MAKKVAQRLPQYVQYGIIGCQVFKKGIQNLASPKFDTVLAKNPHTQRKLLYFVNRLVCCQNLPKSDSRY